MTTPNPTRRWYHPTPDRLFVGLLVVQVFLFLSDRFDWLPFNEQKGWTVLIAVAVVVVAAVVMLVWGLVCLPFRWHFQFGVRSLLLLLVVVSVPLGWFAWEMEKARRQREAVVGIVEAGGIVLYDYDYQLDDYGRWLPGPVPTTPAWLRALLGNDFFCKVVTVTTDPFIEDRLIDDDLVNLRTLSALRDIDLRYNAITDDGLSYLSEMTQLESLSLCGSEITDDGLQHLTGLTNLKRLDLHSTHVTDEGVKKLQQALPNCTIERHPPKLKSTDVVPRPLAPEPADPAFLDRRHPHRDRAIAPVAYPS